MTERGIIESRTFVLPVANIDTDQIYPARYLTTTDQAGLGRYCFRDWRENPGSRFYEAFRNYNPERQQILVSDENFGCGSSREHAAWSLLDLGFKAVVSSRFGDIFRANALKNGLLPVTLDAESVAYLLGKPACRLRIDLRTASVEIEGLGCRRFPLDRFAAHCLVNGIDSLDYLLQKRPDIDHFESQRQRS